MCTLPSFAPHCPSAFLQALLFILTLSSAVRTAKPPLDAAPFDASITPPLLGIASSPHHTLKTLSLTLLLVLPHISPATRDALCRASAPAFFLSLLRSFVASSGEEEEGKGVPPSSPPGLPPAMIASEGFMQQWGVKLLEAVVLCHLHEEEASGFGRQGQAGAQAQQQQQQPSVLLHNDSLQVVLALLRLASGQVAGPILDSLVRLLT